MGEPIKYYGKRRSIVRRIGSFLPLKPPPKVYVSVTPLHSMTNSMIDQESSESFRDTNLGLGIGSNGLAPSKPDLLEPISFGSEVRLLALEQELQDLREQISTIVETRKPSASQPCLSNGNNTAQPPPPPPPLPPPKTPRIAARASLQDHMNQEHNKPPLAAQKSMGELLRDIDQVKLKPIARSPNGRPLRIKRENSPCNDLQEILRRRYLAIQSPDSRNSSVNLTLDDTF
ncbi:mitochondrial fission regulator 2 isoform X3 [Nasonia vitripennis]|nr:mitochondrial fission regulator 2 isoform X3 [Nasonia vitripennis]XP_031780659.1 mitochondrial fission regulator 2 isoform X3 [Nasonia vitripennis]XP_032453492.1 mitochondrial fission regulator 2 isoform X3 [Nasonia vitripennis]XP_032453493.1 mitochondrial fission regulator 2 isoform X3 [Nasonia vitripennis]